MPRSYQSTSVGALFLASLCDDFLQLLNRNWGCSYSHHSRAFSEHTGMTFVRYVNRLRIDRACELLMNSEQGVADICYQVGFNNLSNFNRQFFAIKGMSPSSFRREHLANVGTRFPQSSGISFAKASP